MQIFPITRRKTVGVKVGRTPSETAQLMREIMSAS